MISAFRPEAVRNPVDQKPTWTTSPRPKVGSHCSSTPKKRISRMPIRKVGKDTPIRETVKNSFERKPSRRSPV